MPQIDRPTIFLSSTVHDFVDLRSALKDYLEARGYRTLLSEFTDFTRPLEHHSYQACLETIEQADLFVLFIGRRVGGWYDKKTQVSITRAEYRHAYELAKQGRIKILCFVRSEVWTCRQSAKELEQVLSEDPLLTEKQRKKLRNHPTQFMDNAEAICSFIDEVTRNEETIAASRNQMPPPIANWIQPFATFADVRQAVDPIIARGMTVRQAAGRKALEAQLHTLLQGLLTRGKQSLLFPAASILELLVELNLNVKVLTGSVRLTDKQWSRFFMFAILASDANADHTPFLAVLGTDLLLRYDPATGEYQQTEEYDLLSMLVDQARRLEKSGRLEMKPLYEAGLTKDSAGNRSVPVSLLVVHLHRMLRWVEVIGTASTLAYSLAGGGIRPLAAMPRTPLLDQDAEVAREAITIDDVRTFVRSWENYVGPADVSVA